MPGMVPGLGGKTVCYKFTQLINAAGGGKKSLVAWYKNGIVL